MISGSGNQHLHLIQFMQKVKDVMSSHFTYARQFLEMMDKPDVDSIDGLSPAISIQQKTTSKNPRSTVGTTTEIYDYMRLLFARPIPIVQIVEEDLNTIYRINYGFSDKEFSEKVLVLAPLIQRKKGHMKNYLNR